MTDHVHTEACDHDHDHHHDDADVKFVQNLIQMNQKLEQVAHMTGMLMEATKRALKVSMLNSKSEPITIEVPQGAGLVDLVDGPECPVEVLVRGITFFIDEHGDVDMRPIHADAAKPVQD